MGLERLDLRGEGLEREHLRAEVVVIRDGAKVVETDATLEERGDASRRSRRRRQRAVEPGARERTLRGVGLKRRERRFESRRRGGVASRRGGRPRGRLGAPRALGHARGRNRIVPLDAVVVLEDRQDSRRRHLVRGVGHETLQHAAEIDGPLGLEELLERGVVLRLGHVRERVIGQKLLRPSGVGASGLDVLAELGDAGGEVRAGRVVGRVTRAGGVVSRGGALADGHRGGKRGVDGEVDLEPKVNLLRVEVSRAVLLGDAPVVHAEKVVAIAILEEGHLRAMRGGGRGVGGNAAVRRGKARRLEGATRDSGGRRRRKGKGSGSGTPRDEGIGGRNSPVRRRDRPWAAFSSVCPLPGGSPPPFARVGTPARGGARVGIGGQHAAATIVPATRGTGREARRGRERREDATN